MIYLDHQATTPLDARVLKAMEEIWRAPQNASAGHVWGCDARDRLEAARSDVAGLVPSDSATVVFTSGATEANNLAIFGLAASAPRARRRIVTTEIEHPSVLAPLAALPGFEIVFAPVGPDGVADAQTLAGLLDERTLLVSLQAANSEIGTLQPVVEIAELARSRGILVHSDAAQAGLVGPLPAVDALTISGHKLGGPQGIGALVLSREARHVLKPQILGGGQEQGLRSGTENVAGAVGLAAACAIAQVERHVFAERVAELRDRLLGHLQRRLGATVNGSLTQRLAHNLNVRLPGVDADALLATCQGVAFSAGSACATSSSAPSRVLTALGLTGEHADESVRFGLGRSTTEAEIDEAADLIGTTAARILERSVLA